MFYKMHLVGQDSNGNKYYQKGEKRLVKYSKNLGPQDMEASWYLWLHHTVNDPGKTQDDYKTQKACSTETICAAPIQSAQHRSYTPWKP